MVWTVLMAGLLRFLQVFACTSIDLYRTCRLSTPRPRPAIGSPGYRPRDVPDPCRRRVERPRSRPPVHQRHDRDYPLPNPSKVPPGSVERMGQQSLGRAAVDVGGTVVPADPARSIQARLVTLGDSVGLVVTRRSRDPDSTP